MEIFLILILALLIIIFNSSISSKLTEINAKLQILDKQLKSNAAKVQRENTMASKVEKPVEVKSDPIPPKKEEEKAFPAAPSLVLMDIQPVQIVSEQIPEEIIPPVAETKTEPVPEPIPEPIAAFSATIKEPEVKAQKQPEPFKKPETKITPSPESVKKPLMQEEDWYTRFRKNNPDIEKFIGENLISKIGIAILVIGIALFVKYAIDKDWINEAARVGIGILCGGIVLGFAHNLRLKFKAFSSVLVAGGISIFYFTIGIAFHQYHLFNQTTAFVIMLVITCFSVFISVAYDRVELAALSLIGGFATPLMVSTGSGNYQVLFTYIIILDAGMLVLAYLRKWNLINLMAYGFTMLLYFIWLESKVIYKADAPYAGALIFGAIFYVMFILMNIINNVKERREFKIVELSILLSNTVLYYVAGMQILYYFHPEWRGLFNVCLGVFNMVCAWTLYKKYKADSKLVYLLIGLTLTFITVAAPVQLNGHYITMVWALEGLLLLWLAQRSNIVLYRFASVVVTIIMLFSLMITLTRVYNSYEDFNLAIMLNKGFVTGVVSALSLFGISWLLKKETETVQYMGLTFHPRNYGIFAKTAFIIILYLTGLLELVYQVQNTSNSPSANYIVTEVYHLLFLVAFNLTMRNSQNALIQKSIYYFNYISVLVFVLLCVILPISDLRYNLIHPYNNQVGFIFHYVSIFAVVFLVSELHKNRHKITFENQEMANVVLLTASIVYLLSAELVLHITRFMVHAVDAASSNDGALSALQHYSKVQLHVIKIGFPILWGLLAFLFLFIGMKRHNKKLRVLALILIGITLLKLFIFDINHSSEGGKIASFVILGLVLLIISFMYQKIKALLQSDSKEKIRHDEENKVD